MTNSEKKHFSDKLTKLYTDSGLTPSVARVLVHLSLCEPARQTAIAVQEATELSAGSVSSSLQLLVDALIVRRFKMKNDRHSYYEIENDSWHRSIEATFVAMKSLSAMTKEGIQLHPGNERLKSMYETYTFFDKELEGAVARYRKHTAYKK